MIIPFIGGSSAGRSIAVSSERTINFYPESTTGGKSDAVLIGTPGLVKFAEVTTNLGACRGMYAAGGDRFFVVVGNQFCEISKGAAVTVIGTLQTIIGMCSIAENVNLTTNTTQIMICDGTAGYIYDLATGNFAAITSAGYAAGTHVVYKDGFFIQTKTGTNTFVYSALYDGTTWDALDYYAAEGGADDVVALGKINNELWVFGSKSTEIWASTGDSNNPFARVSNAYIDVGIAAPYTISTASGTIFWIGGSAQGNRVVYAATGYQPQRISTHSIEYLLSKISDISDAVGYCYQQEGHNFYVISSQRGNLTLCYDTTTGVWHERGYYNSFSGINDRHRAICSVYWDNKIMLGDYANGKIYYYSMDAYTDDSNPIKRVRQTGHSHNDSKRLFYHSIEIDIERGVGLVSGQGSDPQVMLQYSDDGGYVWSSEHWVSAGVIGNRFARAKFSRMGSSRDRVWRISVTDPVKWIIIGARADITIGDN